VEANEIIYMCISPNLSFLARETSLNHCYSSVPVKWYLIPANNFNRVEECDSRKDRRTDYTKITSVTTGGMRMLIAFSPKTDRKLCTK